jgi:hypothetical protein
MHKTWRRKESAQVNKSAYLKKEISGTPLPPSPYSYQLAQDHSSVSGLVLYLGTWPKMLSLGRIFAERNSLGLFLQSK